jgi:hypothetical protein
MIVAAVAGLSLVITVAVEAPVAVRPGAGEPPSHTSMQQKNAAVRPLVRSATECVARTVAADPRFEKELESADLNELIVESMSPCADAVRAMIDGYDRFYGVGSGEMFFMGPYLDVLPAAVTNVLKGGRR